MIFGVTVVLQAFAKKMLPGFCTGISFGFRVLVAPALPWSLGLRGFGFRSRVFSGA